MVNVGLAASLAEKERDGAVSAILDRVVGLGWEKGWTPKLQRRLQVGWGGMGGSRGRG